MKIALISPKGAFLSTNRRFTDFWEKSKELAPYRNAFTGLSSGLLIIAALTPPFFSIKLIDENFEIINFDESYDLVAISAMTQQATRAYQIADQFRKKGIKVVLGGIHATVLPEEAKQHADSVIVGEGEETWPRFIEDFSNDNIQPFYRATKPVDLTKSPLPKYDLLKPQNYKVIWVQTSRGCPIDCEFCVASKIYGAKFRHKEIRQVIEEIEFIKNIWKNPRISFADDNMFIDRKYATELLKELIPLKIRWFAQTDISVAQDGDFLKLLKESGCWILFVGFESLSEDNLRSINKYNWKLKQLNKYSIAIQKIQSCGIGVMGAFIVGFDSDNTTVFKSITDFIINNCLHAAQISILAPFPGTRLRDRLEREKRIFAKEWTSYSAVDVTFMPKQMSPQQLQDGLLEVYQRVYDNKVNIKRAKYFKKIYIKLANNN